MALCVVHIAKVKITESCSALLLGVSSLQTACLLTGVTEVQRLWTQLILLLL